jgi:hypothetical protein
MGPYGSVHDEIDSGYHTAFGEFREGMHERLHFACRLGYVMGDLAVCLVERGGIKSAICNILEACSLAC